ncbi:unnamed protein product [Ceratitis capitata]|uniref:(Mediterranean fruit fly) hypothetical protein n=1 Tax=Ceratitis capitata TaxID=7213 RepID=A0A811VAL8_CERCA|nr:unnamed protein product [Ceratitis capitata]
MVGNGFELRIDQHPISGSTKTNGRWERDHHLRLMTCRLQVSPNEQDNRLIRTLLIAVFLRKIVKRGHEEEARGVAK